MTFKKIFVLDGHPSETSLSRSFAEAYADAARVSGHAVRVTHLHDLDFDPDFEFSSYDRAKPLEPPLEQVMHDLEWSDHVFIAAPMWWGGVPAKLKGLIDRVLLPGRAFDTRNTNAIGMPAPMLSGRSGRVVLTSDTPSWFLRMVYGNAIVRQLRKQVLEFVGIRPARVTLFSGASHPVVGRVDRWHRKIRKFGALAV